MQKQCEMRHGRTNHSMFLTIMKKKTAVPSPVNKLGQGLFSGSKDKFHGSMCVHVVDICTAAVAKG